VNVATAVGALKLSYPIVMDSDYAIWNAFGNDAWPADYFIDAKGRIRYHHFGEGDYVESERVVRGLLKENGAGDLGPEVGNVPADGIEAAADWAAQQSPETYLGYRRTERFGSPEAIARDAGSSYSLPVHLALNGWALGGPWKIGPESAALQAAPGRIRFRFHSRDLHLVLRPDNGGKPVRFIVELDGAPPRGDHGSDTGPDGRGEISGPRLFQLVRQQGPVKDRTFEIVFLDPGVQAFAFTFG
jgi:hypothetical protein